MKYLTILLLLTFLSCNKKNMQGYRMHNLSGYDVTITTPEGMYFIEKTKSLFFVSQEKDEWNFNYKFSNEKVKLKLDYLNTHPERHINIGSYIYDFNVIVSGHSDSVEITINGKYFNEKVPFEWGSDNVKMYQVYSDPKVKNGNVHTTLKVRGYAVESCQHINGQVCNLSGEIE